jgi:hypothetical protein
VFSFAACYGLWVLVGWGRKLAITICALSMAILILGSLKMLGQKMISGEVALVIVGLAFNVLII